MARRANGEGTIYQLPDGRWRVIVSVRVLGSLKRISRIRRKRADCVALLDQLRAQISGASSEPQGTLSSYLDKWLAIAVRPHLSTNTIAAYERDVRKHIKPRIGTARLAKLTPMHIEAFKSAMIKDSVKSRAAQAAFHTLRAALRYAVYPLRLIQNNPCQGLKPPHHTAQKMNPFEATEAKAILEDAEDTRWHAVYALAFGCGLRWGEIFGLNLQDIDWKNSFVDINKQLIDCEGRLSIAKPKTKSSVRHVILPAIVKASLRKHRAMQATAGYTGDILFPTLTGKHLSRSNFIADEWKLRLARCSLPYRGFHNTRHTFATLSLLDGTAVPIVSKALGHSSPALTMNVYAHVLRTSEGAAAEAMQRLLG